VYGDMVVMSIGAYERQLFESDIYFNLKEAEHEAKSTNKRYSHEEVIFNLKSRITKKIEDDV
jgi:hypothetical protein